MHGAVSLKVIINCAMSADGKIATKDRKQAAISNDTDMRRVHLLRNSVDAILVGVGTVLADNPKLTVKAKYVHDPRKPVRVVLDSKGRTPPDAKVLDGESRTIIVTAGATTKEFKNAETIRCGSGRVDLEELLPVLEENGIRTLLVEGGSEVIWSFLKSRLADEVYIFIGSVIIGGTSAPTPAGGDGAASLEDAVALKLKKAEVVGDGVLLRYEVDK
jgi:2,5-diamino-6-(ribosylamino)-4(3H)-pyrimidinone 5'-phosphate reductase